MGGTGLYHPPVLEWDWISTYYDHTERSTPSTEPGVDWGCPRFTDLHAAASGVVVDVDHGINAATGRYITIDLDDGLRVRYLHLEEIHVTVGQRVAWGEVIGKTGATGYGDADWSWNVAGTGGSHVHETIFPGHYYVFGRYATIDPWPLTDTERPEPEEDEDMKAVRQDGIPNSGLIIQGGTPPEALNDQVFDALCGAYGIKPVSVPDWKYGTVVREQWRAAGLAASLEPKDGGATHDLATSAIIAGVLSGIDAAVSRALPVDEILNRLAALPAATLAELKAAL